MNKKATLHRLVVGFATGLVAAGFAVPAGAIEEKVLGPSDAALAVRHNNLAAVVFLGGDYAGAKALLQRVQSLGRRHTGIHSSRGPIRTGAWP